MTKKQCTEKDQNAAATSRTQTQIQSTLINMPMRIRHSVAMGYQIAKSHNETSKVEISSESEIHKIPDWLKGKKRPLVER